MKLCPNCNEWFDDDKEICPHCGYRYKEDDENVSTYIDNDLGRVVKETMQKHNPWIVALVVLINISLVLSLIDVFVSKYCWSCYPVIIIFAGYFIARIIYLATYKQLTDKNIRGYLIILSLLMMFYAIVINAGTEVGQDLSYTVFYITPILYIAYITAVLIRFFLKKISITKVIMSMLPIVGVCLTLTLVGAIGLKAQGFALAMCLIPFAISFLVVINMSLYLFVNFKKILEKSSKDNEEIKIHYEILNDEEEEKEDKHDDKDDK